LPELFALLRTGLDTGSLKRVEADGDAVNVPEANTENTLWRVLRGSAGVHEEHGMRVEKHQGPFAALSTGLGGPCNSWVRIQVD
jgi:hypothetical protein